MGATVQQDPATPGRKPDPEALRKLQRGEPQTVRDAYDASRGGEPR